MKSMTDMWWHWKKKERITLVNNYSQNLRNLQKMWYDPAVLWMLLVPSVEV
jgi:hypothetical protein